MTSNFYCAGNLDVLGVFDFSYAPALLFYAYIPIIISSLFFGTFVLIKDKSSYRSRLLFWLSLVFVGLLLNEIIQWIAVPSNINYFGWELVPIFRILVPILTVLFVCVFIEKDKISILLKSFIGVSILTVVILVPTSLNIKYFDLPNCEGVPGSLWNIVHMFEILSICWLLFFGISSFIKNKKDAQKRRIIAILTTGAVLFLLVFFIASIWGDVTTIYEVALAGPIGMVIFLGLLTYLIVKFKAFEIKMLAAEALVAGLIILLFSEFFFIGIENTTVTILISGTILLSTLFGIWLINSVRNETKRKEELQVMSDSLASANDKLRQLDNAKSEFISIASHQLRTPLTSIKGYISLITEGTYGKVSVEVKDALAKVYLSNERLIKLVENLLNVSRIESGRMEYTFEHVNVEEIITGLLDDFVFAAKRIGLYLDAKLPADPLPKIKADRAKITEVISNTIDNAVKYTKKGGVTVQAELVTNSQLTTDNLQQMIRVTVSDTGIGIPKENMDTMFQKFSRGKDTTRLHATGTGLGMFVAKNIIEAHQGRIWVESEGEGKGSRFIIELPVG